MFNLIIRLTLVLPMLLGGYAYANSVGVTAVLSEATGLDIPDALKIPGVDQVFKVSDQLNGLRDEAKNKAQRAALKVVKAEVERRYGPDAAALVPDDLTLSEAKDFDFGAFENILADQGIKVPSAPTGTPGGSTGGGKPGGGSGGSTGGDEVPFMNVAAYNKARDLLPTLDVKGKAPMTGYDRDEFGSEWSDSAGDFPWTGNACDTRNDVLKRDLVKVKFESGSKCEVASGVLPYERYTGDKNRTFDANDGEYDTDFDIEHVVALGNSWVTGSFKWTDSKRAAFANDPINLFAADPSANRQKSDADAATWLPANKPFRCAYISQQITIKAKYDLWVAPAEKDAMSRVLEGCPR